MVLAYQVTITSINQPLSKPFCEQKMVYQNGVAEN